MLIRAEEATDAADIDALHRAAFGTDKIVSLVRALRAADGRPRPISLVAVTSEQQLVGHVMLSRARLDAHRRLIDVLTLSPLAVAEYHRRQGIGGRLVRESLQAADRAGVPLVFLEGDPAYYARLGFERAEPLGYRRPSLRIPRPAFQVIRLAAYEEWMTGTFVYAETFWALDCVGLR